VGFVSHLPYRTVQFGAIHTQCVRECPFSGLTGGNFPFLFPANQQQVYAALVDLRLFFWQIPVMGVDDCHHGQDDGEWGNFCQSPAIARLHPAMEVVSFAIVVSLFTGFQAGMFFIPGVDKFVDFWWREKRQDMGSPPC